MVRKECINMLNNMPVNDMKENSKRKIMFIIIGIICIISIILAIVYQVSQLETATPEIKEEKDIIDFKTIFNNELNEQGYPIKALEKFNEEEITEFAEHKILECPKCHSHNLSEIEVKERDETDFEIKIIKKRHIFYFDRLAFYYLADSN